MAESKDSKSKVARVPKKQQTVRQRAEKAAAPKREKRRIVKKSASTVTKPFRVVWKVIKKIVRPLSFLLIPFKTKPARFVGRVLAAVLLLRFFRDSWKELRQVTWPTARETYRMTVAVFLFALIFSLIVGVIDFGLDKVFREVFVK